MMHFNIFIRQPYPYKYGFSDIFKQAATFGLFIFLFLCIFQPFGYADKNESLIAVVKGGLAYGLITFFIILFFGLLLPPLFPDFFKEEGWTVKREITTAVFTVMLIGLGNACYNYFTGNVVFSAVLFLKLIAVFQIYTFLVAIIPMGLFIIIEQNQSLKKHLHVAAAMNEKFNSLRESSAHVAVSDETLLLSAENDKDKIRFKTKDLLFIKSAGNYIEIYRQKDGGVKSYLLRSSLKRIEDQIGHHAMILKCHRAFLVNIANIAGVLGNSQGYRFAFKQINQTVPIARSFSKQIKETILHLE